MNVFYLFIFISILLEPTRGGTLGHTFLLCSGMLWSLAAHCANCIKWHDDNRLFLYIKQSTASTSNGVVSWLCRSVWGPKEALILTLSFKLHIPASKLKSKHLGSNHSLNAQITASGLKTQPWGSNHSLKAQITASGLNSLKVQFHHWCSNSSLVPQN